MSQPSARRVLGVVIGLSLLVGLFRLTTGAYGDTVQQLREAEDKRSAAAEERQRVDAERRAMLSEERTILSRLDSLEREIARTRRTIGELYRDIVALRQRIYLLEQEITELQERRAARRDLVARRLRANYKINYMTSSGMFAMALRADDLQELLVRLEYITKIRERDDAIIEQHMADERSLAARKTEVEQQQSTLVERQSTMRAEEAALDATRGERQGTLSAVRRDIHLKERVIRELDTSLRQMTLLIARLERARQAQESSPNRRLDRFRTNGSVVGSTDGRAVDVPGLGSIGWPVEGEIIENVSPALEGVTIRCEEEGQPIRAIMPGRVEYADWFNGLGFGQLVVLNHGEGVRSFYAHLRDIVATQGDAVERGQTIGTVGSTGSLIGAALYFEIRRGFEVLRLGPGS